METTASSDDPRCVVPACRANAVHGLFQNGQLPNQCNGKPDQLRLRFQDTLNQGFNRRVGAKVVHLPAVELKRVGRNAQSQNVLIGRNARKKGPAAIPGRRFRLDELSHEQPLRQRRR
jgi:hypothetical protein